MMDGSEEGTVEEGDDDGVSEDSDDGLQHIRQRIQNLNYDGDTETAKSLRKEAQRTLDHQLRTLDDIDNKAMSILRVNTVLIGLILSAFAIAADFQGQVPVADFSNGYLFGGVISLLLSAMVAAATYTASDTEVGFSYETVHGVIDANLTEREFEVGAASSYAHWIKFNDVTNIKNAPLITVTSGLLILGILSLSIGVYEAVLDYHTEAIALIAYLAYVVLLYFTGITTQIRRWFSVVSLPRRLSWLRDSISGSRR